MTSSDYQLPMTKAKEIQMKLTSIGLILCWIKFSIHQSIRRLKKIASLPATRSFNKSIRCQNGAGTPPVATPDMPLQYLRSVSTNNVKWGFRGFNLFFKSTRKSARLVSKKELKNVVPFAWGEWVWMVKRVGIGHLSQTQPYLIRWGGSGSNPIIFQ